MGGQRHASAVLPLGNTRYTLYWRLCGLQSWSGQVRKTLPPPGVENLVPHQVSVFNQIWVFSADIHNSPQYQSFTKICPVGAALLHEDMLAVGGTDGRT